MAKLGHGLLSGDHSRPPQKDQKNHKSYIRPLMFKSLVGRGHTEFSTGRQQDALEFLQHLVSLVERNAHSKGFEDPSKVFSFQIEEKLQCSSSNHVSFKKFPEKMLLLPIPLERAVNKAEVLAYNTIQGFKSEEQKKRERETRTEPDPVRPLIHLKDCFDSCFSPESISNWYSPVVKENTVCIKRKFFASFPPYLVLQMGRFAQEGLATKKLDVFIDVPDDLELEHLRSTGPQPGEQLMAESAPQLKVDEVIVSGLMEMGFPRRKCEWAWYHNQGKGSEVALEWLFAHMDDPLDQPLPLGQGSQSDAAIDAASVELLSAMGFTKSHCIKALKSTNGDCERAADWLFSHPDEPMDEEKPVAAKPAQQQNEGNDGPGKYKLFAFITHMGTSTSSGHYVAHINVDGKWILFDDRGVKESQEEPRKIAYIYFYKRIK